MIKRAIISVYDKSGLEGLAKTLEDYGVQIISSGGTARRIKEIGYPHLIEVSAYTGHPESPGGLVKTLHPKVHGGLLLDMEDSEHAEWMNENSVKPINIVISNLYPFEKVAETSPSLKKAADNIDIGGPSMTRSAAKAALLYDKVLIVTDPSQYPEVIKTLNENNGKVTTELRHRYAHIAFKRTRDYDEAIVKYLEGE